MVALEPQPLFAAIIRKKFARKPDFTLVLKAVSRNEGRENLRLSYSNPAVSTISEQWVSVISEFDGRTTWDETIEIEVTTLDALIREFGFPDFCKIDVEGGEENVLEGCSAALPALSFEFFPGRGEQASACIDLLERKGRYEYNMSFRETFRLVLRNWVSGHEMKAILNNHPGKKSGDVYAVIKGASRR